MRAGLMDGRPGLLGLLISALSGATVASLFWIAVLMAR